MTCIHGLDEINCPSCRIMISSLPKNSSKIDELYSNPLKSEIPYFQSNKSEDNNFIDDKTQFLLNLHKTSINLITSPRLLTKLPNFENKMLQERLEQIEVSKSEVFKISEINALTSPEWKIEDKD